MAASRVERGHDGRSRGRLSVLESMGRLLVWLGGGLLLVGLLMIAAGRITEPGRLPGDIVIRRENVTVFIPLATMVLVSFVLTIVLNAIVRLRR